MKSLFWRGPGVLGLLVLPTPALAHSPVPGIEGFYLGLLHPFSTPAQALLMISLGILVGRSKKRHTRWMLLCFLLATSAGIVLGDGFEVADAAIFAAAILASTLAALSIKQLFPLAALAVAIGGVLVGVISLPDGGQMRGRTITILGSFVGSNVFLLYFSGAVVMITDRFSWAWIPVAFRVAAAWVAAISAIMLAFYFAPEATEAPA